VADSSGVLSGSNPILLMIDLRLGPAEGKKGGVVVEAELEPSFSPACRPSFEEDLPSEPSWRDSFEMAHSEPK